MAATGKTPILLYGSTTATNQPSAGNLTNSSDGCEIAINVADKNLFFKDATNTVNTVPIRQSSASSDGWLSSTDWSTFNSKQPAGSYALTSGTLAQFASTTSAQLAGVISDETGSGSLVFATSPTFSTSTNLTTANGRTNIVAGNTSGGNKMQCFNAAGNNDGYFAFEGYNIEYARFTTSGNLAFPNGQGIDFSATAGTGTSELLADYEEGTWTPTITPASGTITASNQGSHYVKVGALVMASGYLNVSSVSSPSGAITIGGLPYTNGSSYVSCVFTTFGGGVTSSENGYINLSATTIVSANFNANTIGAGANILFTAVYSVV